jgi:hypothetical protein
MLSTFATAAAVSSALSSDAKNGEFLSNEDDAAINENIKEKFEDAGQKIEGK